MDNIDVAPSSSGSSVPVATDEIGNVHFPVYKISYGADGSQTPVDATNPLPTYTFTSVDAFGNSALDIPAGNIISTTSDNKYGYAPDGVQTTSTDIWDRADAAATQQLWASPVAPGTTTGVLHNIVSTSVVDDVAGIGAKKIQIYGLTDWDSDEISEIIEMDGTTNVSTVNSYIIIYRMKVIQYGALGPNVGVITATNAAGSIVTAQINANQGQTQMAIYGIPSTKTAYLTNWYASVHNRTSSTATTQLLYCTDPVGNASRFLVKETRGLCSDGTSSGVWEKNPYLSLEGPGILKINAIASAADQDMGAGFDLILVDK